MWSSLAPAAFVGILSYVGQVRPVLPPIFRPIAVWLLFYFSRPGGGGGRVNGHQGQCNVFATALYTFGLEFAD